MRNPFVVGQRIYLRPVEPADADVLAACNNDPQVRVSFFTHTPTSVHLQTERAKHFYEPGSDYIPLGICIAADESLIGVTALHRVDLVSHAAVFSICISDTAHWGHGYAKEATNLMLRYGFDVLNLHRIQLHVWAGNPAGIAIYEHCGFQREGLLREAMCHNGEYCDFLVMGILEGEWRALQASRVPAAKPKTP